MSAVLGSVNTISSRPMPLLTTRGHNKARGEGRTPECAKYPISGFFLSIPAVPASATLAVYAAHILARYTPPRLATGPAIGTPIAIGQAIGTPIAIGQATGPTTRSRTRPNDRCARHDGFAQPLAAPHIKNKNNNALCASNMCMAHSGEMCADECRCLHCKRRLQ